MPQERLSIGAKLAIVFFALVIALSILGFGLLAALSKSALSYNMKTTHVLPHAVIPGQSIADITVLNNAREQQVLKNIALKTRNFVMGQPVSLPRDPSDVQGFSEKVMSHLREVRTVIVAALLITLASVVSIFVGLIVCLVKKRMKVFFTASLAASVGMLIAFSALGVAMATNFSGLFTNFHRLFFAEGTWVFSAESLLIRTFPLQFWLQEAIVWAIFSVLVAFIALLLGAVGRKCVP